MRVDLNLDRPCADRLEREHATGSPSPQAAIVEHTERELLLLHARYNRLRELLEQLYRWDTFENNADGRAWKAEIWEALSETASSIIEPDMPVTHSTVSRESLHDVIKAFSAYEADIANGE